MFLTEKKKLNSKNISCVIPTHNRDEYLKEAINSAIKQSQAPIEIIISKRNWLKNSILKRILILKNS